MRYGRWCVILIVLAVLAPAAAAADEPLVKVLTDGYVLAEVKGGWQPCVDRPKWTMDAADIPPEFVGLTALQTKMSQKRGDTVAFELARPCRLYAHFWLRLLENAQDFGQVPEGWHRYLLAWGDSGSERPYTIYYRDFDAGRHEVTVPSAWVTFGFQPLDALSPAEQIIPDIRSGSEHLVFTPDQTITAVLSVRSFAKEPVDVACDWMLTGPDGQPVTAGRETLRAAAPETVRPLEISRLPAGLYHLVATFRWGQGCERSIDYPLFVRTAEPVRPPDPKTSILLAADVRRYVHSRDPLVARTYAWATAAALSEHGFNCAYVTCTAGELDAYAHYGMQVVMDYRRPYAEAIRKHPALRAYFYYTVIDRKDMAGYKKTVEQAAAEVADGKPLYHKPMSFGAGRIGCGRPLNDPILLWEFLKPKGIRWLRCVPFVGPFDVLRRPGGEMSFGDTFALAETAQPSPWWMMVTVYGEWNPPEGFLGKYVPTAADFQAISHVALARGAQAVFTYGSFNGEHGAILDTYTLQPLGTAMEGAKRLSQFLAKASRVLLQSRPGVTEALCEDLRVLVVPRSDKAGKSYLYVVNTDARGPVTAAVTVYRDRRKPRALEALKDVVGDEAIAFEPAGDSADRFSVELAPGEGRLLRLETAAGK